MGTNPVNTVEPAGWRLKLSAVLFGLSIAVPVFGVPIVVALGLSKTVAATLTGGLLAAAEIMGVAAVALIGKSGFALIKKKVFGFFKQHGPPRKVGRLRYRTGLVMFFTPVFFGWVSMYAAAYIPGFAQHPVAYALVMDFLLLSGLLVLGGDFWDKLHALFVHDAEVLLSTPARNQFPQEQ